MPLLNLILAPLEKTSLRIMAPNIYRNLPGHITFVMNTRDRNRVKSKLFCVQSKILCQTL